MKITEYDTVVTWKNGKPFVSDYALQQYIDALSSEKQQALKEVAKQQRIASRAENKWREWAREETDGMRQAIIALAQNYADYWGE